MRLICAPWDLTLRQVQDAGSSAVMVRCSVQQASCARCPPTTLPSDCIAAPAHALEYSIAL